MRITPQLRGITIGVLLSLGAGLALTWYILGASQHASGIAWAETKPAWETAELTRKLIHRYVSAVQNGLLVGKPTVPNMRSGDPGSPLTQWDVYQKTPGAQLTPPETQKAIRREILGLLQLGQRLVEQARTGILTDSANYARGQSDLSRQLAETADQLDALIGKIASQHLKELESWQQEEANSRNTIRLVAISTLVVAAALLLVLLITLPRRVIRPAQLMAARLDAGRALPEPEGYLGTIARAYNSVKAEQRAVEDALERIATGRSGTEFPPAGLSEVITAGLLQVNRKVQKSAEFAGELEARLADTNRAFREKDATLAKLQEEIGKLRPRLAALEQTLALAELDEQGRLVTTDKVLADLWGYSPDELKGRELLKPQNPEDAERSREIWSALKEGRTWYGLLPNTHKTGRTFWLASAITPIKAGNGNGTGSVKTAAPVAAATRYLIAGYEVSQLKQNEQQLQLNLQQVHDELERTRRSIQQLELDQRQALDHFNSQKEVEARLQRQRVAVVELTQNTALLQGQVREALQEVTLKVAATLQAQAAALWLFTDKEDRLRCLDRYDGTQQLHMHGGVLTREEHKELFATLLQEPLVANPAAAQDARLQSFMKGWESASATQGLMAAPVRLGGQVVGSVMAEFTQPDRPMFLDEQTFLASVADLVSLTLEQGNRKVMEEEWRHTMEQSAALEEELRQNAEEIEATNEEMRRTQVELRGQINALNNSAIVSETNLNGVITYANSEFIKVYGYTRPEVLGQNHRLLKSQLHTPEFFGHMWQTITQGRVWRGEVLNRTKGGKSIWVMLTITPVLGLDGTPVKFISVAFDIHTQKDSEAQIKSALDVALQQEEELRRTADELEYANDEMRRTQIELAGQINALNNSSMVYETDMEGVITYANEELLETLGFNREELLGQRYTVFKSGRQAESLFQEQWRTVLHGQIWRGEVELRTRSGRFMWVVMTNTPVLDDGGMPIKSINVLFDISEQKEQEFRLKKQQVALLEVTSSQAVKEGELLDAFQFITQVGRQTMGVDRATIWLMEDAGSTLRCKSVNASSDLLAYTAEDLSVEQFPVYFGALEADRVIAAADVTRESRLAELVSATRISRGTVGSLDVLIRRGNQNLGVISFEHRQQARAWYLDEQSFATSLADTVTAVLEQKERQITDKLKEAYSQLEMKNLEILRQKAEIEEQATFLTESIRYAKRIQQNILPSKDILDQHLQNYFFVYRPRDIVGGDFYWFANVGSKRVIVVADGTGHGVPGAFLTLIGYLLLNQIVNEKKITRPADILYHLHIGVRTALKQDEEGSESRDGMDVSICTLDAETLMAEYAGANLPFNYYQDWELHVIRPDKYSIGGEQMEEERTFTNHAVQMKAGDAVYLYTDGFVDQIGGPEEKRFSTKRFRDLVLRTQHESMATQRALVNLEWKEWKDDREQLDDVTVFGMRIA